MLFLLWCKFDYAIINVQRFATLAILRGPFEYYLCHEVCLNGSSQHLHFIRSERTRMSTPLRRRRRANTRQRFKSRKPKPRLLILNLLVLLRVRGPDEHSDSVVLACGLPSRLSVISNTPLDKICGYAIEIEIGGRFRPWSGFVSSRQRTGVGEV